MPVGSADSIFELESDGDTVPLLHDGENAGTSVPGDPLVHTLKRICHIDLATYAEGLVFVHSGVVLTEYGLLVLPGRSFAGKSTLVKSLVALGCKFFSDEYAVVDEQGLVRPFPRSLCERLPMGKTVHTPAVDLGWERDQDPVPLRAVVVTKYKADEEWKPKALTSGEAVLKMLENTVSAQTNPGQAISHLATAIESTACIESFRGESDLTAKLILDWMSKI